MSSADTAETRRGWPVWLKPAVVFLLALIAYAHTLKFEFVFDDRVVVVGNRYVQSWDSLGAMFTEHVWSDLHSTVQRNYYRPVFLLHLLVNHTLFGLDPAGWHATTVLLHAIASLLLFFMARRLCGSDGPAAATAILFALHPIHIEAVAWVSGSAEPLAASLLLGSFLCYLRYCDAPPTAVPADITKWAWLGGSLLLYGLAAFSKEGAALLPLLIGAHAMIFPAAPGDSGNSFSSSALSSPARLSAALRAVAMFLPMTAVYLAARIAVLGAWGYAANPQMTTGTMLLTIPGVIAGYLRRLVWPIGLSAFYDLQEATSFSWRAVGLPALLLLLAVALVIWLARRSRAAAFGAVWLAITLLPVLNLRVFPPGEFLHDRYLYLPSAGFCLLLGVALSQVFQSTKLARYKGIRLLFALRASAVLLLALAVWGQSRVWRSNTDLYWHGMRTAPRNSTAANNYALEMLNIGAVAQARSVLEGVAARDPNFWLAHFNLGLIAYRAGDMAAAEQHLRRAIAVSSTDAEQFALLSRVLFRAGKTDEAIEAMKQALGRRPRQPGFHFALAVMLAARGMDREALSEFRKELELDPDHAAARQQALEAEQRILKKAGSSK